MFPSHIPSELLSPFHSFLFLFLFTIFPFTALSLKLSKMSKKTFKCFINGNSREMAIETPISTIRRCIFFFTILLIYVYFGCAKPSCCAQTLSSCGEQARLCSRCGFSLRWLLSLQSTGSRVYRLDSCGAPAYVPLGMRVLYQGLNPCPLHWQVDF